jgi:cyclophilin family peptidyl-prolyl cis-trans isomerase
MVAMTLVRSLPLNCLFSLCCLLSFCVILSAQEEENGHANSKQYAQSEEEAAELGSQNKAFMDSFAEYRELAKKLTAMKIEYQDASPSRQSEIDTEYRKLYQQGREFHQKSILLALDAHDEAPNRNPYVINLLYSTVGWEFSRENYEESIRVFKRLVASGIDKAMTRYYAYAGLSAMLSMHYAEAEEWLVIAGESDELKKMFADWAQSSRSERELLETIRRQMSIMPQVKEDWTKEQAIRAAETEAGAQDPAKKLPRVELLIGKDRATPKGKIVLELFENEAPNTVANFVSLVEKGFYNNVVFHRVLPNFMAQGGDPTGSGRGGPGYAFDCETGNKFSQARKHFRGSISMANAGPNTNGSQFFLTFVPTSFLDGRHTVFGRVVEGFEVLADIQRVDPADEKATIPELDRIIEAKVLNKRDHNYEVKRNAGR